MTKEVRTTSENASTELSVFASALTGFPAASRKIMREPTRRTLLPLTPWVA